MKQSKITIIGLVCCLMLSFGLGSAAAFEYDTERDYELAGFVSGTKDTDWRVMTVERSPVFYDEGTQAFNINERNVLFLNRTSSGPFGKLVVLDKNEMVDNLTFAQQVLNGDVGMVYNITYWVNLETPQLAVVTKLSIH